MQAPPPLRSSPERDSEIDIGSVDPKPTVTDVETVGGASPFLCVFMDT